MRFLILQKRIDLFELCNQFRVIPDPESCVNALDVVAGRGRADPEQFGNFLIRTSFGNMPCDR